MKLIFSMLLVVSLLIIACSTTKNVSTVKNTLLSKAIKNHGGKKYQTANIAFEFRKRSYTVKNNGGQFEYTVRKEEKGQQIYDVLNNEGFVRHIDGVKQNLSAEDAVKYGNSLNSVIYFAQLPYKLDDPAVKQTDKGIIQVKGKKYRAIKVSFAEEGGGTDHDDTFYYWVNQQTNIIDYLAYRFHVDKGGVRFRSAYNPRRVGGILFQDFVNYKADINTPLGDLPAMLERGALKELSKIELENVRQNR